MKTEKELRKEIREYKKQHKADMANYEEIASKVRVIKDFVDAHVSNDEIVRKTMLGTGGDVDRTLSNLNLIYKKIQKLAEKAKGE